MPIRAAPYVRRNETLGFMLYDIDHPGDRASLFFRSRLKKGVMRVPAPNSPEIRR
jgi:CRISPR-associated protein Cas5d